MGKPTLKRRIELGDVTIAEAMKTLRDEIVEGVKAVSNGHSQSFLPIVEKGKELLELEKMLRKTGPAAKDEPTAPRRDKKKTAVKGGGIKRVVEDEEHDEDADLEGAF